MAKVNTRWNGTALKRLLGKLKCRVKRVEREGDHDTTGFELTAKGANDRLYVYGFHSENEILDKDSDNCTIEMIEVSDRLDSDGGLNSEEESTGILYGRLCSLLRKEGYIVVARMDDYF